jgi:hypothetical protein
MQGVFAVAVTPATEEITQKDLKKQSIQTLDKGLMSTREDIKKKQPPSLGAYALLFLLCGCISAEGWVARDCGFVALGKALFHVAIGGFGGLTIYYLLSYDPTNNSSHPLYSQEAKYIEAIKYINNPDVLF